MALPQDLRPHASPWPPSLLVVLRVEGGVVRLYIAGPMTGLPDFNYPAFFAAEKVLIEAGYEVENPARNPAPDDNAWLGYMRQSLVQISRVDGIALLPGWSDSRGARVEYDLAKSLGLDVRTLDEWTEGRP